MNIQHVRSGDYYIPDLKLPEETRPIGKQGRMYRRYLEEHHPVQYANLVLSSKMWTYLADLNEECQERLDTIVHQMQIAEGVPETLKAHVEAQSPKLVCDDSESLLEILYDIYAECNSFDNEIIRADFHKLYQLLNGMSLKEMDKINDPVSVFCRDQKKAGLSLGFRWESAWHWKPRYDHR